MLFREPGLGLPTLDAGKIRNKFKSKPHQRVGASPPDKLLRSNYKEMIAKLCANGVCRVKWPLVDVDAIEMSIEHQKKIKGK